MNFVWFNPFQMQVSLEVFENYIPKYFLGARKVYKEMMKEMHVNKNTVLNDIYAKFNDIYAKFKDIY